jgi:hypothetical protein
MNNKFLGMMVSVVALVACGDSGSSGGSGGSGGGPEGGSSTGGSSTGGSSNGGAPSTGGSGGSTALTCAEACGVLYDCGAENMNCMGFSGDPAEKEAFVGDDMGGCIQTCNEQAALINLIQPDNCAGTVMTLKGVSPDFAEVCDNGFATGGAGGAM